MLTPQTKIRTIVLLPDATRYEEWADVHPKELVGSRTGDVRTLNRQAIFIKPQDPVRFDTLEELLAAPRPFNDLSNRRRYMLALNDEPFAVLHDTEGQMEAVTREQQVLQQTWRTQRSYEASGKSDRARAMSMGFMALAAVAALFGILISLMVFMTWLNL